MSIFELRRLGPSAEVQRWAEETRRLNSIFAAWIESAAAQGLEIELPAMPVRPPDEPEIAETARLLSDAADDDLTLPS